MSGKWGERATIRESRHSDCGARNAENGSRRRLDCEKDLYERCDSAHDGVCSGGGLRRVLDLQDDLALDKIKDDHLYARKFAERLVEKTGREWR